MSDADRECCTALYGVRGGFGGGSPMRGGGGSGSLENLKLGRKHYVPSPRGSKYAEERKEGEESLKKRGRGRGIDAQPRRGDVLE